MRLLTSAIAGEYYAFRICAHEQAQLWCVLLDPLHNDPFHCALRFRSGRRPRNKGGRVNKKNRSETLSRLTLQLHHSLRTFMLVRIAGETGLGAGACDSSWHAAAIRQTILCFLRGALQSVARVVTAALIRGLEVEAY